MKWKLLLYFLIANRADIFAKKSRSVGLNNFIASKERRLRDENKYWRTPENPKPLHINTIARTAKHPGDRGMKIYGTKYRALNNLKNILRKVRDGHKRPVEVHNRPHIKYISRNGLLGISDSSKLNTDPNPQKPGGEIYGNLDNLGITYGKTNQRVLYSWNRKNNPKLRVRKTKQRASSGSRKNNPEVQESQQDELSPAHESPQPGNDKGLGDPSPNESKVSRNVLPSEDTPRSASVYPLTKDRLVYGNLDNLGITYGKTNQRVLYSESRRNTALANLLRLLTQASAYSRQQRHKPPVIRDGSSGEFDDPPILPNTRREISNSSESDTANSDSEYEFNPNNPYTVHKNRYLQNYLWKHKMTGDHMNLNPYAPRLEGIGGATGPELLLSRKWWYFNQIVVQVNTEKLFSIFHQEIAKRFDRVKDLHPQKILWFNIRNKVKKEFQDKNQKDSDAKMGYFIHVVPLPTRRLFQFNQYEGESVIGVPSNKWHLPAAESLLPGHTLSRPSLGMLKSAVTFPHTENGATVYGNSDNLGIRYGVRSGRILYSQNRRMLHDNSWRPAGKSQFVDEFILKSEAESNNSYESTNCHSRKEDIVLFSKNARKSNIFSTILKQRVDQNSTDSTSRASKPKYFCCIATSFS